MENGPAAFKTHGRRAANIQTPKFRARIFGV
jgi:hypothetical protein